MYLVDKTEEMIGSYGPAAEAYEKKFQLEEAPSGMLARGHYEAKVRIKEWWGFFWFIHMIEKGNSFYYLFTICNIIITYYRANSLMMIMLLIWNGPGPLISRRIGKSNNIYI